MENDERNRAILSARNRKQLSHSLKGKVFLKGSQGTLTMKVNDDFQIIFDSFKTYFDQTFLRLKLKCKSFPAK